MRVFALTAKYHVSANEMDAAASALPLGLSRQEARQIHRASVDGPLRVDALIPIDKLAEALESAARTEEFPGWGVNLINRSESALSKGLVQHDHQGTGKVQPQAFRMILMRTERYLTAGQLDHLLAWADKDADGNVDYRSFLGRGPGEPIDFVKGAAFEGREAPRTKPALGAVLRRVQRKLQERDVSSLAACGRLINTSSLTRDEVAALLARLPLGLSEAEARLAAGELPYPAAPAALADLWRGGTEEAEQWARTVLSPAVAERLQSTFSAAEFAQELDFRLVMAEFLGQSGSVDRIVWLVDKDRSGAVDWAGFCERWCGGRASLSIQHTATANGTALPSGTSAGSKNTPASTVSAPQSFRQPRSPKTEADPPDDAASAGCCGLFRRRKAAEQPPYARPEAGRYRSMK